MQKGVAHPRRQAEELLGEALGIGRMGLYLEHDRPLNPVELEKCRAWLKRRGQGEPLQYITGGVDFFDCRLKVDGRALIPRQETEILADKIAQTLATMDVSGKVLWDICCGTGCLGIALKKRFPALCVSLLDLSLDALALAAENAASNNVDVKLKPGDLLTPFSGMRADFIVCNPPYISSSDYTGLDVEVRVHEPKMALVGGETGLEFYARLADELPKFLNPHGRVWLEIGDGQAQKIQQLFCAPCWIHCAYELDWSGRERFFSLEIE